MKYCRKPGVRISASAYHGSDSAVTTKAPRSQGTHDQTRRSRPPIKAQPSSGSPHSTTDTGPLASRPMMAPTPSSQPGPRRVLPPGAPPRHARKKPIMTIVLPRVSAMSVTTAPLDTRNRAAPASSATECHAARCETVRACIQTSAATATPST